MSKNLNRRTLFGAATAAVASEIGAHLLTSPLLPRTAGLASLRKAVLGGDGQALGAEAFLTPKHPIFILTVHAKWESAGWLFRPNQQAVGVVNNPNAALSDAFATHGLTKQFGNHLKPLEGKIGLAVVPATTTSGNHVYDGLRLTMSETGCLPAFVNEALGSLMTLYFASVGTADGATACFGRGGTQLITYGSMDTAVSSIMGALDPLKNLPGTSKKLLTRLNDRVTKDQRFRANLESLANRLEAAKQPLNAALALAKTAPMQNADQMIAAQLKTINPFIPQIDAAASLMELGLLQAAVISGANSDPNGGGDHAARGGNNIAYGARSPNEIKSCVAQALVHIYERFPNAIVSIVSDGGRSANGGDQQAFEGWITGPVDIVDNVFLNAEARDDSAKFGQNPPVVDLSNGTKGVPNEAHLMATVAKAAGVTLSQYPYIPGLLKKA